MCIPADEMIHFQMTFPPTEELLSVFTIDGKKQKLSLHKKEIDLDDSAWGCKGIAVAL